MPSGGRGQRGRSADASVGVSRLYEAGRGGRAGAAGRQAADGSASLHGRGVEAQAKNRLVRGLARDVVGDVEGGAPRRDELVASELLQVETHRTLRQSRQMHERHLRRQADRWDAGARVDRQEDEPSGGVEGLVLGRARAQSSHDDLERGVVRVFGAGAHESGPLLPSRSSPAITGGA